MKSCGAVILMSFLDLAGGGEDDQWNNFCSLILLLVVMVEVVDGTMSVAVEVAGRGQWLLWLL
jgi:hypothetical protein